MGGATRNQGNLTEGLTPKERMGRNSRQRNPLEQMHGGVDALGSSGNRGETKGRCEGCGAWDESLGPFQGGSCVLIDKGTLC